MPVGGTEPTFGSVSVRNQWISVTISQTQPTTSLGGIRACGQRASVLLGRVGAALAATNPRIWLGAQLGPLGPSFNSEFSPQTLPLKEL